MFARVTTVAFEGIEARGVDVQVQIGPGLPHFTIVGLPDKVVAESRASLSISLLPICPRKGAITIFPSRSG